MRTEALKFLHDVQHACDALDEFLQGKSKDDYTSDRLLRSGVERQLMIVGEALLQAFHLDPTLEDQITAIRQIIGFRHIIVHGYSVLKDETVWGILHDDLPTLRAEVERLLAE